MSLTHPLLEGIGVEHGFGLRGAPEPAGLLRPRQVHGRSVVSADACRADPAPAADAVYSQEPGVPIGVATADCVPILCASSNGGLVAAVHAGWRGLAQGVIPSSLDALRRVDARARFVAAIGPHIGPCCYEVDEPVLDALRHELGATVLESSAPTRPGHRRIDLGALAAHALERAGVAHAHVGRLPSCCTRCDAAALPLVSPRWRARGSPRASHRREGLTAPEPVGRLPHRSFRISKPPNRRETPSAARRPRRLSCKPTQLHGCRDFSAVRDATTRRPDPRTTPMSNFRGRDDQSPASRMRRGRGRRPQDGASDPGDPRRAADDEYADEESFELEPYADDEDAGPSVNVVELKEKSMSELAVMADELSVENAAGMRKQDLIFAILKAQTANQGRIYAEGVLETLPDGFGFLRAPDQNYLAGPGRHLRLALADPPLQPAHRRHRARSGAAAEGGRALLRAAQGRPDQLRGARRRRDTRSCSTT